MAEDGDVDLEEGMLWLPAQVLEEACESKEIIERKQQPPCHKTLHTPGIPKFPPPHSSSKPGSKLHQRPRYPAYWPSGGPGMQAIFIDSGQRSCGTGVFLPQRGGFNFIQRKKPACSPVLLPSRVVQALNLNVHALGSQLAPQKRYLNNKNGSNKDAATTKCCVPSQAHSPSSETFLPEEWSY